MAPYMTESAFITKNEAQWAELERFNHRLNKSGIKKLTMDETRSFGKLFRLAGYHLAYAKTHYPHGQSVQYLNRLVGVAHNHFYIREKGSLSDVKHYFLYGFPAAVRESGRYSLFAMVLFFFGLFFAALYVAMDATRLLYILPQGLGTGEGTDLAAWDHSLMSAVIMTNNISVAVTAFGLGITAGIGTALVLVYNGIVVGGLFGFLSATGSDMLEFFSLILPHGVLELTAIFLCGGCGLMMGRGLLIPGKYSRKHALIYQAKKAVTLIPGIVALLIIAGLIEGFFTPLPILPWFKLGFAALTGIGLWAYLRQYQRRYT
jgi:uncharacterized membrane protein SpoIIM required for sporulation